VVPGAQSGLPDAPGTVAAGGGQIPDRQSAGTISGTVIDRSGAVVAGARLRLTRPGQSTSQEALSGDNGQFSFAKVEPGPFQLTTTSLGFATQASSGTLHSGETCIVPPIVLAVATALTEVRVGLSQAEVAQEQVQNEEKQRVLGFIPNFYVSYDPHPAPLSWKQKFALAWKTAVDPVSFGLIGVIAGIQQSQDDFSGYGQGAQGYAKRYGASYANFVSGTFIGSAILPSLLKQDPRYFYKGSGSKRSRMLYALANSLICKGDNGNWQANYSSILGNLAAGGISNLYYPPKDRDGVRLTLEDGAIGIGATAGANLIQEFLIRKLTPHVPNRDPAEP
jgi:carboxypeptidase family protein